jgi:hypothetical protein
MAFHGEEVIIAKNNFPLVELVPHRPRKKRKLELLAGQIEIPMISWMRMRKSMPSPMVVLHENSDRYPYFFDDHSAVHRQQTASDVR